MWLVIECAGLVCALLTYVIVLTVQIGMIRVGVWEGLRKGELSAIIHLVVFQYHCIMIYWSHFKCMTTEPGVLPKNYNTLSISKIGPDLASAIMGVKREALKIREQVGDQAEEMKKIENQITEQIKHIDNEHDQAQI